MSNSIEIKDLLTYSDIYGLGLTATDVTHLNAMYGMYNDKSKNSTYIYKPTFKNYDLTLQFDRYYNRAKAEISIEKTNPVAAQKGYPLFKIAGWYFKVPPKVNEVEHIHLLSDQTDWTGTGYWDNVADFKKEFVASRIKSISEYETINHDLIKAWFWVADKPLPTKIVQGNREDYKDLPSYILHVVTVLQLDDDTRIAFYIRKSSWGYYKNQFDVSYGQYITKPGDDVYNWTDPDRYCSHINDETKQPRVVYPDSVTFPQDSGVIGDYRRGKNFLVVDKDNLEILTRRWLRKQQDLALEAAAIKQLESKIKGKIDQLANGIAFIYNDIEFKPKSFVYEGQEIMDNNLEMIEVLRGFYGQYSEDHLNFDTVFHEWLTKLQSKMRFSNKITTGKIGDVNYKLELRMGVKGHSRNFYINNHRIVVAEIAEVLRRAICFPNTQEFENFVASVSACSLRYHRFLASGIVVKARDEHFNEDVEFKIDLERNKNKNSIVVGNKKWHVSDTNRLLRVTESREMSKVIGILLDDKVIGMTGAEIKDLLDTGRQTLIDARKKERELLEHTMQMFGIEEINDFACNNGKYLSGYLVHGKMRDYIVERSKCMVFEYPTGRYICMVDKGQNEHTNTARLVNRFYALSNDSKLAKEISTL